MLRELKMKVFKRYLELSMIFWVLALILLFISKDDFLALIQGRRLDIFEDKTDVMFMAGLIAFSLLCGLFILFSGLTGKSLKNVKNYTKIHPEYTMKEIEQEYYSAKSYEDTLYYGNRFIIYAVATSDIIAFKEILWAYYSKESSSGVTARFLVIRTWDKKEHKIMLQKEANIDEILIRLRKSGYPIVIGYTEELAHTYKKKFETFKEIAKSKIESIL